MTRTIALAFLLASVPIWAEDTPKPPKGLAVKVYQVKPGNAQNIHDALCRIGICDVSTQGDLLVVRTSSELAPAVDALVPRLDSTPVDTRNVELTFYVLQVSREPLADAGAIPPELESTAKQIKSVLAFQGVRLVDTSLVRTRNQQRFETSGYLPGSSGHRGYGILGYLASTSESRPVTMRLDNLKFTPGGWVLSSSVDIKEGQKAVIGKTGTEANGDYVLVVSGKVVD